MNPDIARAPRIYAVVLAAGEARRFDGKKLLETLHGEPLVARAARLARECYAARSVLVTGHRAAEVTAAAGDHCEIVLENPHYRQGLGTSIARAASVLGPRADALLLLLADQPCVSRSHLEALRAAWSGDAREIVATSYGQACGPPVLLPAATFTALEALTGDAGARALFDDDRFVLRTVFDAAAGRDVDTPADLEKLRETAG
jgi:molybdenum cofactor cytidylyltransferase